MKTTLTKPASKKLLNYLIITGGSCNLLVGINAIFLNDYFLLSICLLLACFTCIGYILSMSGRPKMGANTMLISYIIVFTFASFTSLVAYPLMLVFPMIIGLVNLFHSKWKIKAIYVSAALIGCIICIVNSNIYMYGSINYHEILNSILIGTGLIFGFLVITELHGKIMFSYQVELEENKGRILEKNKDLKEYIKSNLQLESFAYLASHEMRTPIQNISNFSQLLERKLKGKLDVKEKELFEMVKMETWRMNIMMGDLLKLSQLSKRKMTFGRVYGEDFIAKFLSKQFKDESDHIKVNNFPKEFYAAESHLSLLFLNLIDNAFKFSKNSKETLVVIDCSESNNEYLFSVKDNGIGIDDDYKERVFLIFKKLNSRQAFSGSGVGLSMCKEIVDRHKGKIWIEDNPEGGAIVKFIIAKDLKDANKIIPKTSLTFVEVLNKTA